MTIKKILSDSRVPIKIWTDDIEETALAQLRLAGSMPFVFKHIAVMPDVHAGIGSTVGSVIATKGAIVPACVGVDIGCGMSAMRLAGVSSEDLSGKLPALRAAIERAVPVGFAQHGADEGAKVLSTSTVQGLSGGLAMIAAKARDGRVDGLGLSRAVAKFGPQMGTLGGGNHFIEICVAKHGSSTGGVGVEALEGGVEAAAQGDEAEVWLMLHSGSRGLGNLIGQHHINCAKGVMERAFIKLEDQDLSYLWEGSVEYADYLYDMQFAQSFAYHNRRSIQELALRAIYKTLGKDRPCDVTFIDCHHNYVSAEHHFGEDVLVTRKGAVRAGLGELGIIPGSMGAKSFIVSGLGNPESFCSCSHGAGRRMGRKEAKRRFTEADLAAQTAGVECRKDKDVVDEIPGAYKDIDVVMENQNDLVSVVRELKQVLCVKG